MRAPSINVLRETFRLDSSQAKLVRAFAKAADDADDLRSLVDAHAPETARYVRSMYSDPYRSSMWRTTVALHAINEVVGGYGVEGLGPDVGGPTPPPYEYINAGDTYATTLIYNRRTDTLSVGSWGDIVERHPSWSGESAGLGAASSWQRLAHMEALANAIGREVEITHGRNKGARGILLSDDNGTPLRWQVQERDRGPVWIVEAQHLQLVEGADLSTKRRSVGLGYGGGFSSHAPPTFVRKIAVPDTVRAWQLFEDRPDAERAAAELAAAALAAAQELESDLQGMDGDSAKHQRIAAKDIARVYTEMLKPVMTKWRNVGANDTEPRYVGQQFLIDVAKQVMGIPLNEWTRLEDEL